MRLRSRPSFLGSVFFVAEMEALDRIVRRLESRLPLDEADKAAIHALPVHRRNMEPASYLVREGEAPESCAVLLSGFAYRHKVTTTGARQIIAVHMPGEFLDLQNSFLEVADHNVQALTRCDVVVIP